MFPVLSALLRLHVFLERLSVLGGVGVSGNGNANDAGL
jgi:uncharacterized protein GlcG (DUF336 family)